MDLRILALAFLVVFLQVNLASAEQVANDSKCQKRRELGLRRKDATRLVPECLPSGSYKTLQCFTEDGKNLCQCWAQNGDLVKGPSEATTTCDCVLKRYHSEKQNRREATSKAFVPRCDADGSFSKKQCNGSSGTCWCVDKKGEKIAGTEAKNRNLKCA